MRAAPRIPDGQNDKDDYQANNNAYASYDTTRESFCCIAWKLQLYSKLIA